MRPDASSRGGSPRRTARTLLPHAARSSTKLAVSGGASAVAATVSNAPLMTRCSLPSRSTTKASDILRAGSNGTRRVNSFVHLVSCYLNGGFSHRGVNGILVGFRACKRRKLQYALTIEPRQRTISASSRALHVRVPVLSAQRTSIAAASCAAERRVSRTPSRERLCAKCSRKGESRRQRHRDGGEQRRKTEADQNPNPVIYA